MTEGQKWRTLVIDPPWRYQRTLVQKGANGQAIRGAAAHYNTMSLADLSNLPVAEWAEPDAHLYLWATNTLMLEALTLIDHWVFKQKTILTWVKSGIGLGSYFRNSTEHVLFAVRGKATRLNEGVTIPTHFMGEGGRHSEKPQAFYDMVETASPGPYIDIFARKQRMGWDVAGDQVYSAIPELAHKSP